jgi:hypothetical protein
MCISNFRFLHISIVYIDLSYIRFPFFYFSHPFLLEEFFHIWNRGLSNSLS